MLAEKCNLPEIVEALRNSLKNNLEQYNKDAVVLAEENNSQESHRSSGDVYDMGSEEVKNLEKYFFRQ